MTGRESFGLIAMTAAFLLVMAGIGAYVLVQGIGDGGPRSANGAGGARRTGSTFEQEVRRAEERASRGDFVSAADAYASAMWLDPQSPRPYRGRAAANLRLGNPTAAAADYTSAIERDGRSLRDFMGRAGAYEEAGEPAAAIADYDTVVERSPDHRPALLARGRLHKAMGSFERAVADLSRAGELSSDRRRIDNELAWAMWGAGDHDGAMIVFDRIVAATPGRLHAYFGRGVTAFYLGRLDEAESDLVHAVLLGQDGRDYANYYLWLVRATRGDRAGADAGLRHFVSGTPETDFGAWSPRIAAFLLGEVTAPELVKEASEVVWQTLPGQLCEAHYYTGAVALLDGDLDGAAEAFRRSIDTDVRDYYEYYGALAGLSAIERLRARHGAEEGPPATAPGEASAPD